MKKGKCEMQKLSRLKKEKFVNQRGDSKYKKIKEIKKIKQWKMK